ncbi:hypothetical protein ASE63_20615 [Bosea sp. Root381]|nr:hypothetical protein ASE63_20615 [Bosea sp. Root381]
MTMNCLSKAIVLILACIALTACQTPQSRQAELSQICSDPANREPGNFYFSECQSVYPSGSQQLQRDYVIGSPAGR